MPGTSDVLLLILCAYGFSVTPPYSCPHPLSLRLRSSRCIRRDGGLKCTYLKRKVHKAHKPHKPRKLRLGSSNRNETLDLEAIQDGRREITVVATRNNGSHIAAVRPHGIQHEITKLKR